jgi:Domain of unknown function (DUF4145)
MSNRMPADTDLTASKVLKVECASCGGKRNCNIRAEYANTFVEPFEYEIWTMWRILQCRGCEHVFVQFEETNSAVPEGERPLIVYWPALSKRKRPEWERVLIRYGNTKPLYSAMEELYGALNNDLHMLAAIGIRTSFDIAAQLLGIDPEQTFQKKLKELVAKGLIGALDEARLEVLVEAGNASAHRGWRPSSGDLSRRSRNQ